MAQQFHEDPTKNRSATTETSRDKSLDAVSSYVAEMLAKAKSTNSSPNQTFYSELKEQLESFLEHPELLSEMGDADRVALMEEFSSTMHYGPEAANVDLVSKAAARAAYMAMADKVYSNVGREAPREPSKVIELSRNNFGPTSITKNSGLQELSREMADDFTAIQGEIDPSILRQNLITTLDKWRGRLDTKVTELQAQVDEGRLSSGSLMGSRNRLNIGLYRLERLVDALEPAVKQKKEATERTRAVNSARTALKETLDPGIIERERNEREVLDAILRDGASQMHTSLRSELGGSGSSGFQTRVDRKFGMEAGSSARPLFLNASGRQASEFEMQSMLKPMGINEIVDCNRVQEDVFEDREVEVAKSGLAGMFGQKEKRRERVKTGTRTVMHSEKVAGGKQEALVQLNYRTVDDADNAQFRDYSNRTGQMLNVIIRLPESLARKSMELMKTDPAFIRKMVEQAVLKQQGIPEETWKNGEKNAGVPLRPPYDQWSAQHGGKSKIYVRSDLDAPIDYKIHNEETFPVE